MTHTVALASPGARQKAHTLIDRAPHDAIMSVKIGTRSLEQNAKMWAMLSDVSSSKPQGRTHTPEVWKSLFMHAMGHEVRFVEGLNGEPFPCGFRTSRLTVSQMGDMITFIQKWGDENGVEWTE